MTRSAQGAQRPQGAQTRAAILRAARERFAAQGYERTTIRGVAADAEIDPSMVMRYFGSKEKLFEAALAVDLRLPDFTEVPAEELPGALVRHFLDRWEGDPADDALLVLLRSAVTNERAAERMREVFAAQVAPALAAVVGPARAARVAGLVAAQLLGLGLTRYLLRLPAVTSLTPEAVVAGLTPALAATLSDPD
ncbi:MULTISPECIES: TetR family transcriptional regulator [unclassified Streptomyces]|uniref:TetR/AcrR family transcriptional regulator n=1 Tax=unclassified Streptomyces TaxID=2593676 RepID=UPI002E146554|nr:MULTISPECIES: TetR family transcriptional regulator [unclassified Streptomyces]WSR26346.1 TetR family transcriptional regulator [Streptomyces sp. NBC_01205]